MIRKRRNIIQCKIYVGAGEWLDAAIDFSKVLAIKVCREDANNTDVYIDGERLTIDLPYAKAFNVYLNRHINITQNITPDRPRDRY
jgi:hypothetical protein